ncbi:sugar transferase [Gammaproteobacteria bacterium]|nr:sugar transferase [Gammaproteobacteria bacterium]
MTRLLDFLLALLAILILFPLMLPILLILKFTGDGEVFYYQKRKGKHGKDFFLIKLSTMHKDSVNCGLGSITVRDDPRIKFMGHTLRRSKLNELPQVVNILLGDLSVVGPRPLVEGTTGYNAYSDDLKFKIFSNRPGLTGIGSIVFRDEEAILSNVDNPHDFYVRELAPYKADLELWYFKNKSLKVDIGIIVCTAISIILPKSLVHEKIFSGIPEVPEKLKEYIVKESSL